MAQSSSASPAHEPSTSPPRRASRRPARPRPTSMASPTRAPHPRCARLSDKYFFVRRRLRPDVDALGIAPSSPRNTPSPGPSHNARTRPRARLERARRVGLVGQIHASERRARRGGVARRPGAVPSRSAANHATVHRRRRSGASPRAVDRPAAAIRRAPRTSETVSDEDISAMHQARDIPGVRPSAAPAGAARATTQRQHVVP